MEWGVFFPPVVKESFILNLSVLKFKENLLEVLSFFILPYIDIYIDRYIDI